MRQNKRLKTKKLTSYLSSYKKEFVLGPFFKLLEAVLELFVPMIMADIIDVGIAGGDTSYILWRGLLLVGLAAVGLGFSLTCQYMASKCSQGFGTDLRNALFKHVNSLSHAEFDKFGASSLITRITGDVNQLQTAVAMLIRLASRTPFIIIGSVVMSFIISPKLSLIFIAAAVLIAVALYFIMSRSVPHYKQVQGKLDDVSQVTRENLAGVRVVRAFSKEEYERKRFESAAKSLSRTSTAAGAISALLNPVTYLIINMAVIAVLWFGGVTVNVDGLKQGEVVALVNYLTQISLTLVVVANLIVIFTKASASAARVKEVLDTSASISDDGNTPVTPVEGSEKVTFDNVSFGYGGGKDVLTGINLSASSGTVVGVIGGTGSGKSSLVNLIPRFYDATKGSVKIDGVDVRDYPLSELRDKIGYVPQQTALFSGTLRDNMKWGNSQADDAQIMRALELAQAADFVSALPDGLDTAVSQGGRNFSGGQRQRLTIARALVRDPEIVILDDSASALDFATDLALRRALRKGLSGATVFIVSQRASSIRHADKIIVLDKGVAVGIGTHATLIEECEVYREIVMSQEDKEENNGKEASYE